MNCPECRKTFEPKQSQQVYCSQTCSRRAKERREYWRKKQGETYEFHRIGKCPQCGDGFEKKSSNQVFCSSKCFEHDRSAKRREDPKRIASHRDAERRYRQKNGAVTTRYCECGTAIRREGKDTCLSCEKKEFVKSAIRCQKCGDIFVGDRRVRYCASCRTQKLPSVLDAIRNFAQRLRAKKAGLIADFTQRDWREVKRYFNNRCAYCEQEKKLEQDHFIPITKGGAYTKGNIVPACKICNVKKNNKMPWEWLPRRKYEQIALYLRTR